MKTPLLTLAALLLSGSVTFAGNAEKPATQPYYEDAVANSNSLRVEQAKELDDYIVAMKKDNGRLGTVFKPDYSSPQAFERSAIPYRQAFCDSIGYPPPGQTPKEAPKFDRIGEDGIGTYYRASIAILPGVHAEGIYIVPKGLKGKAPLVISMHGGGGSPEVALFHGGSNYHDMVRGGVKAGYVVFAPQHLFSSPGLAKDIRNKTDDRLRLVGTSLTAVEVAKITRSIDAILTRPEVDPNRIAMVGLSYGGYYALVTPAIDTRIKVSVSSCYYGVQEGRYDRDELSVPSDFKFKDRFTLFRDSDVVALICPRALEIQAGSMDDNDHREPGKLLAPLSESYYANLGLADRFHYLIFEGHHEFHDESAWAFLKTHL
ncbi:MAG TPA: dienelactone hydrolase family protein [Tepidisphaeraceae bacterium]|jgi:dienelactone hydrolase|nr:dienelactone hydrolase family protein [Tepidisphaeraceae bacterium]